MPRPARPWFRVYSEALDNPKLQRLKPALFMAWFNLTCLANTSEPRGSLPTVKDAAFRLRLTERQMQQVLDELTAVRLVDFSEVGYAMHDWDDWQYESDARATDGRQKRGDNTAVAPQNNGATLSDAPPRAEQSRNRAETEAETEQSAPAHPFAFAFAQEWRNRRGRSPTSAMHGEALALETEYGADACFVVARELDWQKPPAWMRPRLEDRRNGISQTRNVSRSRQGVNPSRTVGEHMADAARIKAGADA